MTNVWDNCLVTGGFTMGSQTAQIDALGRTTLYEYDSRGRRVKRILPMGQTELLDHDAVGNLAARTDFAGKVTTFAYDELNRLAVASNVMRGAAFYDYNAVGSLAAVRTPNGVTHGYTYNALNRLTNLQVRDVLLNTLANYAYDLAPTGHRTGVTEADGRTVSYTYDDAHRLTSETMAGGTAASPSGAIGYILDAVGNRLQRGPGGQDNYPP
jgi:YD repeat-containing protein